MVYIKSWWKTVVGAWAKYAEYERANVQQAPLIKFLWVFGATNAISFALMAAAAAAVAAAAAAAGVQLPVRFAGSNNAKYTAQQKRRKNTQSEKVQRIKNKKKKRKAIVKLN